MFLRVTTKANDEVVINTSQVVSIYSGFVNMSDANTYELDDKSLKELLDNIFGNGKEANPTASVHTETLINELHRLLGGRGEAKPTTDRKARLKARMKDFSEEELKIAAKNCGADEFMSGANEQNKKYATIDYLLRTSANVNKWLEAEPQKKRGMF